METQTLENRKILLAQKILSLDDTNVVLRIETFLDKLLADIHEEKEEEFDAKLLTFDDWNKQFDDEYKLDDFIPEYGMTVRDFRYKIYNSEKGDGMSKEVFFEKLNNLK